MFHKINNKHRFLLENKELSITSFNNFFYNLDVNQNFEIDKSKSVIGWHEDFYTKNMFNHLKRKSKYKTFSKKYHVKFFLTKNFKKKATKIIMAKNFEFAHLINNKNVFNLSTNNNLHLNGFLSNSLHFLSKTFKSQSINFFFLKNAYQREFFKKKIQMKNHSFNKLIVNIDIFSKKLEAISYEQIKKISVSNLEKFNTSVLFDTKVKRNWIGRYKIHFDYLPHNSKLIPNTLIDWEFKSKFFRFDKKQQNCLLIIKKLTLKNIFITTFKQNYKNVFIYNLIKLLSKRNNHLTNEFSNFTNFIDQKNFFNEEPQKTLNYLPNFNNKFVMNNFLPYYNFFVKSKFYKNVLLRNIMNPGFSMYYSYYLFNFLEVFLKRKVWLKINTKANSVIEGKVQFFISEVFKKNRNDQYSVGRHFYLLEFLEILYITLYYRDLKFFSYWFKKTMEKLHLKKHRKLIKVVQNTLKNNIEFLELVNVKGFTMDVRGKLGTTGNSKKKHYAFTVGTMSPTSKNHDMSMNQTTVRTNTGVLGVTITLSY